MVLDADLWIVRERGDLCTSTECIYKVMSSLDSVQLVVILSLRFALPLLQCVCACI